MLNVDFSTDMQRMVFWAERMGLNLYDPHQLTEPYTWCHNHILSLCSQVCEFSGVRFVKSSDSRVLVSLETDPYAPRLRHHQNIFNFNNSVTRIELPRHSSSFFSPNRQGQWEKIFHSRIWESLEQPSFTNPLKDLLYILQVLLPGMFVLVEVGEGWSTQCGIPPRSWILDNCDLLLSCIGQARFKALARAAGDVENTTIDSRTLQY